MLVTNQHADVYNLMGSLRKTGDYKQAYTFYRKALEFDPEHKGALEYPVSYTHLTLPTILLV